MERVSKLIAKAGIASRRAAEEMIAAGRVTLNGHTFTEQGTKADILNDRIIVDGHPLRISEKPGVVLVFHKPRLVMTTKDDPGGRSTVMDFLPRKWQSLHPVGRLDFDTSGVLLLTDDGELTHLLTHPSHGAEKVYEARVRGVVEPSAIEKLERGVRLDDGPTAPCRAKLMAQRDKNALVQLVLREGRNRQVRRMLDAVGHPANALRRISFAGVELEGLPAGEFRILLPGEVKALRRRVESKVKKLSSPKGKFSKRKIPPLEAAQVNAAKTATEPEVVPFKTSHTRLERAAIKKAAPAATSTTAAQRASDAARKRVTKAVPKTDAKAESKREVRRPRNAPDTPEAPRLERKGSKARAISDAQRAQKPAPRSKPDARSAESRPATPRTSDGRPLNIRNPVPRNPDPRDAKPSSDAPKRAPVANRIDKRWKS
ncbi:rRNA pseudouridine synthase [Abditibacterium utsteinense]|uniref:Pseudouridine synthase n=2 Tax=Abditibacterium utsteinense TaxID=1960156 RepID=A0A2S8SW46_9BACT|nr:rRNA pseudouridine synthase [Abditibacterium utsteinense]